ncbi:MAG: type II toxin-antitoxin system HicA family toxin [Nitrospinae bacterium]|nr:type II toxin-antitoxin system HicA family toxin [Nitrospinota bacterium]
MSKREKLVGRFKNEPPDFTWQELVTMLKGMGYRLSIGAGSRRRFVHGDFPPICLHEPHPSNILKRYQIGQIKEALEENNLI